MFFNPALRLTRITAAVIALFVILSLFIPVSGYAGESDYTYKNEQNGELTITGYNGTDKAIVIPEEINGVSVTKIDDNAFEDSTIESVVIRENISYIGSEAFWYCTNLKSVIFEGKTLPEMDIMAFDGVEATFYCYSELMASLEELLDYIGAWESTVEEYNPGSEPEPEPEPQPDPEVTPDEAFSFTLNNDNSYTVSKYTGTDYKKIGIPSEYDGKPVTTIGKEAFTDKGIETVKIPDSVKSIDKFAFYNCTKLVSVDFGNGIVSIGDNAFQRCNSIKEFNIPASVSKIGWDSFAFCKTLENIKVNCDNAEFKDIDGVLYSKDGKNLIYYPNAGKNAVHYDVPEGTEIISEDSFKIHYQDVSVSKLETISYPNSLKKIGSRAFRYANLKEVTLYGGIELGDYVYDLCKSLKKVNVAERVTVLPKGVFYGVDNLEELNLPSTLEIIEDEALERLPLESIELPDGLKKIGKDAFASSKLKSVDIPATVTEIGDRAFYSMTSLESATFASDSQLKTLNQYAFCNDKNLVSIDLPEGLETISHGAFSSCYVLNISDIPASVTNMGDSVFAYTGISEMVIPEGLKEIGTNTFYGSSIEKVVFPQSFEKWGTHTFAYCKNLEKVTFTDGIKITNIPTGTFIDCLKLRNLELPKQICQIDNTAFLNNVNLTVEYKAPLLKRHPLDCHNMIISNDDYYELEEDGYYYTTRDLWFGESYVAAGYKLTPQNNVRFEYTGSDNLNSVVRSVTVPENMIFDKNVTDSAVKINILAEGAESGGKVSIKAVGKNHGDTVTGTGILALAKGDNAGLFASVKTLKFDTEKLSADSYEIYVSLDGETNWIKGDNSVIIRDTTSIVKEHTITSKASKGGTITSGGRYVAGSDASFTYTPHKGYKVSALYINGNKVIYNPKGGTYNFTNIQSDQSIDVFFEVENTVLGDKAEPKKAAPKSFKVKAKKKKAKLTWKKANGASKYQIAYKKKGTKKWKHKTISSGKKSVTIKKLKSKKKYQFKIRSCKVENKKKVYSKWSKTRVVKIK